MTQILPTSLWTQRADLAQLVAALGAGNVRWVGGAVRDTLLGMDVKDIDAATPLLPDEVTERLQAASIKVVPTGIDHGTVTAVLPDGPVEITTLRHDVATDGRRATVAFATEWQDDAARRDFTINALYTHPQTLEISDYFGGLEDLSARRVRFIGDARERIREDHLRILRYYRFQARFGAELDPVAENACAEMAGTLKGLSRERVAMELLGILGLPDPAPTIARMKDQGILPVILPEAGKQEAVNLANLVAQEQASGIAGDAIRRLAALLPAVPTIAESVAVRLRLSRAQRSRLATAANRSAQDSEHPRALAYREGPLHAIDRLLLTGASIEPLHGWVVPELPLKGGEIVASGVTAGPQVARILQAVETRWIDEGFPGRLRVQQLLAEELRAANSA